MSEIRARAVIAMLAEGWSSSRVADALSVSAPRVSQLTASVEPYVAEAIRITTSITTALDRARGAAGATELSQRQFARVLANHSHLEPEMEAAVLECLEVRQRILRGDQIEESALKRLKKHERLVPHLKELVRMIQSEEVDVTIGDFRDDHPLSVFVIGPIGNRHAPVGTPERERYEDAVQTWERIIVPACDEAGLGQPIRADKISRTGEITEQVFQLLRKADIVIADVTGGNPNVMYELGARHTRDLLTIQIGEAERLPFDISAIRTIRYRTTEGGYIDARNELRRAIEIGLSEGYDQVTLTRIWNDDASEGTELPIAPTPEGTDDQDVSLLETMADFEDALPRINETLLQVSSLTENIASVFTTGTEELNRPAAQESAKARLLVAIRVAERLDEPSEEYERLAGLYEDDVRTVAQGIDLLFNEIEHGNYTEDDRAQTFSFLCAVKQTGGMVKEGMESARSFRDALRSLSRMAKPLKVRTDRMATEIDRIIEASSAFQDWADRAATMLASEGHECS